MDTLIFLGGDYKKGAGGIASVLREYSKLYPKAIFIFTLEPGGKVKKMLCMIVALFKLFIALINNKNNIVHIHGASKSSFYRKYFFYKVAKLFRAKIIYHIHGGGFGDFYLNSNSLVKKKIKLVINNVDCLICLSPQWETFYKKNFSPKKIRIINNIIPYIPIYKSIKSKEFITFLFLGDITERKGTWLLLKVIDEIKSNLSGKARFLIGGKGEIDKLNTIIKKDKLENIVKYIGWVDGETKQKSFLDSNVFILPSYIEGLPISILEAMSYGLSIISTNVGGIPEVVHDEYNGYLIEPRSKEQLKKSILKCMENPSLMKSYGENSLKLVKPFYPEEVKKELDKLYNELSMNPI